MAYYIINATSGHSVIQEDTNNNETTRQGNFVVRNTRPVSRLKQSDQFAMFIGNDDSIYRSERVQFFNRSNVEKVSTERSSDLTQEEIQGNERRTKRGLEPLQYFEHTVKYVDGDAFTQHKFLDDYSYSLLKVYKNYIDPYRHFSKKVTEIPKTDFRTLENESIYVARTLFGRLINALPFKNRLQYLIYCIEHFNQTDLRKIPFSQAFPVLKEFVGSGIIQTGNMLTSAQEMVDQASDVFGEHSEIYFGYDQDEEFLKLITENGDAGKIENFKAQDSLAEQAGKFEKVFALSEEFNDLFSEEGIEIDEERVKKFDKAFSKRAWPVDYNTRDL